MDSWDRQSVNIFIKSPTDQISFTYRGLKGGGEEMLGIKFPSRFSVTAILTQCLSSPSIGNHFSDLSQQQTERWIQSLFFNIRDEPLTSSVRMN